MNNPNQQKPNQQQQNNPRPGEQHGGGGQKPGQQQQGGGQQKPGQGGSHEGGHQVASRVAPTARRQAAHPSRLVFTGHSQRLRPRRGRWFWCMKQSHRN